MTPEEVKAMIRQTIEGLNIPKMDDIVQRVSQSMAEFNRPKYGCSIEQFQDIFGRAAAVSPNAQTEMASLLTQGKTAEEMQARLLVMATTPPDTHDAASGNGGDGTGLGATPPGDQHSDIRSFKQITDDDFFAGLSNPAAFAVN